MKTTFYHFEDEAIIVDVKVALNNEELIFDGFDYGKKVKDSRGVSDEYEYSLSFDKENTRKFFELLGVSDKGDDDKLAVLKKKFGENGSISVIKEYCDNNGIETKFFSWP